MHGTKPQYKWCKIFFDYIKTTYISYTIGQISRRLLWLASSEKSVHYEA